eukprot:jgi/Psemu1/308741/fgenesh1_kg.441_\
MNAIDIETISMGSGKYLPPLVSHLRYAKAIRLTKFYAAKFAMSDPPLAELYQKRHDRAAKACAKSNSKEARKVALDRLKVDTKDMDVLLSDGRRWLCGDRFLLVDVAWAPVFRRLEDIGYADERYVRALKKRPSYISAINGFPPLLCSPMKKLQVVFNLTYDRLFGGKENMIIAVAGLGIAAMMYQKRK